MSSYSTPLEESPTGSLTSSSGPSENSPLIVNAHQGPAVTPTDTTERDNRTRRRQNHALGGIRLAPSPSDDALNAPLPRSRAGIHGDGVFSSVASRLTDLFSPCLPHRRPARSPANSADEDNGDDDEARLKLNAIYSYLGESIIVSILSGCCFVLHFTDIVRFNSCHAILTLLDNS